MKFDMKIVMKTKRYCKQCRKGEPSGKREKCRKCGAQLPKTALFTEALVKEFIESRRRKRRKMA